jgi:putative MATE family efflux protein
MFDMSKAYLMILFIGACGNGFYNVLGGILRGLGDSVFPLFVLLGTVAANIALDILFVAGWGFNMGVAGAALATIIAQLASSAVLMVRLIKMRGAIGLSRASLRLNGVTLGQLVRLGLPTGIQMGIMFLSNIVMQPSLMAMGSFVFAALGATMSVDGFAIVPCQAFNMAASTFTGQNIGADRWDRVKKGSKTVFVMCVGVSVVMVAAMQLFGPPLLRLFTDKSDPLSAELVTLGMRFIRILIPAYILMSVNMTFTGVMRGAGDSVGTMWISVLINVIFKVPLTFLIVHLSKSGAWPNGDPASLFYATLICMCIGAVITLIYYRIGKWRTKALVKHANANRADI